MQNPVQTMRLQQVENQVQTMRLQQAIVVPTFSLRRSEVSEAESFGSGVPKTGINGALHLGVHFEIIWESPNEINKVPSRGVGKMQI